MCNQINIPAKIRVGAINYTVKCADNDGFDHDSHVGSTDLYKSEVLLRCKSRSGDELGKNYLEEVFLHELIHCINNQYLTGQRQLSEDQVDQVAKGLHQVLKDNNIVKTE